MLFTFFSYVFLHLLATTKFYTLSLHDALPIFWASIRRKGRSVSKEFNQAVHADRAAYYRFAESRESDPQKKVKGRAFPIRDFLTTMKMRGPFRTVSAALALCTPAGRLLRRPRYGALHQA